MKIYKSGADLLGDGYIENYEFDGQWLSFDQGCLDDEYYYARVEAGDLHQPYL